MRLIRRVRLSADPGGAVGAIVSFFGKNYGFELPPELARLIPA
jgi:hypothetical protein